MNQLSIILKKPEGLTPEKQQEILTGIERSHDLIRQIAKEILAGKAVIRKSLAGYSIAEKSVIYIILESISETPIRFTGPRKGMILIFREWSMSKNDLVIKTNNIGSVLDADGSNLEQWLELFL